MMTFLFYIFKSRYIVIILTTQPLAVTDGPDTAFAGLKKKKKKQVIYLAVSYENVMHVFF